MTTIMRKTVDLPAEEILSIDGIDNMFFNQIQMNGDKLLKKYPQQFAETKERVLSNISVQYLVESFPINMIEDNTIIFAGGETIESPMLARVLAKSEEVAPLVVTVHGYDDVEEHSSGGFDLLFIDGWGSAIAECIHKKIGEDIKRSLEKDDLFATDLWSPGQHNVNISLQKQLFSVLRPEEIGVTLSKTFMMTPKKSISSFIGIGRDSAIEDIRSCDFCEHRETCPSAYK